MAKSSESHPILALPFVADVEDSLSKRNGVRRFWNAPVVCTGYREACEIGRQWAADYVEYARTPESCGGFLLWLMRDMAEWERGLPDGSDASGYAVGFLSALDALAGYGAEAWGGAQKFVDAREIYRKLERDRKAWNRERELAAVARMNGGRAAKKAVRQAAAS